MVKDDATKKSCVCTQRLTDMLRAAQPVKKSSLMKVTCAHCGKVFRQTPKENTASTVKRK